jgi:hypothetical protein
VKIKVFIFVSPRETPANVLNSRPNQNSSSGQPDGGSLVELRVSQAVGYPALTRKVEIVLACDFDWMPTIITLVIVGQPSSKSVYAVGHELQASEISAVHCYLLIQV